ncbi:hypothetical protein RND71_004289 [Anisodus tanguticus]|uniref:Glutaredoxin domain-containing protein n=1 Tax=Anisodus tanguticus TaxID=243964 RepID=A0AAE1VPH9_9SOLA|nr:hypothetical protein RND71_004289 [Anisodus tanguticus]
MGCSASRSYDFVTTDQENPWNSSSSSHSQQSPYSYSDSSSTPVSRTLSLPTPLVHHPAIRKGDTNHLVSLTSTTYGSLVLIDSPIPNPNSLNGADPKNPLSPDSVINTWELMEGLDDFDFHTVKSKSKSLDIHSELDTNELEKTYEFVEHSDSKPLWKHLSEEQLLSKMDPNVASSYRQALSSKRFGYKESDDCSKPEIVSSIESELSNASLLSSLLPGNEDKIHPEVVSSIEKGSSNASLLSSLLPGNEDKIHPEVVSSIEKESSNASLLSSLLPGNDFHLKGTEDKIVLYFTSLRGIRKTYEECCIVRMIFKGFRVCVDERDVSMDSSYRKELQSVLEGKIVSLPQVFIGGKYVGGAEEINQLHEAGELAELVEGFAVKRSGFICEGCGDARFVPCPNCNGSRKVFEEEEGKLRRCPNCNENGLIRCHGYSPWPVAEPEPDGRRACGAYSRTQAHLGPPSS